MGNMLAAAERARGGERCREREPGQGRGSKRLVNVG